MSETKETSKQVQPGGLWLPSQIHRPVSVLWATEDQQTKDKRKPGAALMSWRQYFKVSSLTAISFSQTPANSTQT